MGLKEERKIVDRKPKTGDTNACWAFPQAQTTSTELPSPCLLTQLPPILIRFSRLDSRSYFSCHNFSLRLLLVGILLLVLPLALYHLSVSINTDLHKAHGTSPVQGIVGV